jgi:hypothetical protein
MAGGGTFALNNQCPRDSCRCGEYSSFSVISVGAQTELKTEFHIEMPPFGRNGSQFETSRSKVHVVVRQAGGTNRAYQPKFIARSLAHDVYRGDNY